MTWTAPKYSISCIDSLDEPDPNDDCGLGDGMDDHDWEGAEELTQEEKDALGREVDEAIRQGALVAGKLGSGGARALEDLLRPEVDWREVLREFIQSVCAGNDFSTWSRPNRRFVSAGVYMPSGISQQVKELVIALDTSGSIGQRELTAFLSEVKAVCDMVHPERIRLLYWDTEICGDESYRYYRIVYPSAKHQASRWWGYRRAVCAHYMTEHKIRPASCDCVHRWRTCTTGVRGHALCCGRCTTTSKPSLTAAR